MKRNQFVIAILMLVGAFTSAALFSSCSESKGDDVEATPVQVQVLLAAFFYSIKKCRIKAALQRMKYTYIILICYNLRLRTAHLNACPETGFILYRCG